MYGLLICAGEEYVVIGTVPVTTVRVQRKACFHDARGEYVARALTYLVARLAVGSTLAAAAGAAEAAAAGVVAAVGSRSSEGMLMWPPQPPRLPAW